MTGKNMKNAHGMISAPWGYSNLMQKGQVRKVQVPWGSVNTARFLFFRK